MSKKTVFLLCFFTIIFPVFSLETGIITRLYDLFPESVANDLMEQRKLQRVQYKEKSPDFLYCPHTVLGEESKRLWQHAVPPTFLIEALYLVEKKTTTESGSDIQRISEILRSISTLEGITYYSESKGSSRILYEKSYVIDDPETKEKLSDPIAGNANGMLIFTLQKDSIFGENVYRYNYRQTPTEVGFFCVNINPLNYLFVKVINSEKLLVSLVVIDLGDVLVVYVSTQAEFLALPGLEKRLTASFSNRADALYNWFLSKYDGESE